MASTFDPITLEILWRRLISIVDEADGTVARTAFSSLLRDAHDYTCMFTDRQRPGAGPGELCDAGSIGSHGAGNQEPRHRTSFGHLPARETSSSRTTRGPWRAI